MINVELIDFTGKGRDDEAWHAADLLMFTKMTRLNMESGLLDQIKSLTEDEKLKELEYMASTIPSSWEFADVTFLISNVTRACAQQITRTRNASFAMQSQRIIDARKVDVTNPFEFGSDNWFAFEHAVSEARSAYQYIVDGGGSYQDARGVLPMNSVSNIVAKYNFRSFVDLIRARSSLRVQGEYGEVVEQMRSAVVLAWPWASLFLKPKHEKAIEMLERIAKEKGITPGAGEGWEISKAIDLLR